MTKEITQEERLDLTDIREETEAYHRKFLDYCEVFELDPEKVMQEYFHDIAINSDEYKKLKTENERLQAQLDREIHINRKMKSALEKYADLKNWRCDTITGFQSVWQGGIDDEQTGNITAQEVLKEIDNKE